MPDDHVGYLEFDGRITRLREARCSLSDGQLDIEAKGPKARLRLYGIPFPGAALIDDLAGKVFGPDSESVLDDPIAEGGIETKQMQLSYLSLMVRCKRYDPQAGTLTVAFEGEVVEADSGFGGPIEGTVRCSVVDNLWG